jgi:hypothetical protein
MAIPPDLVPTACDIFRPFGAGAATYSNVACRLVPDLPRGRAPESSGLAWTHQLIVDSAVDIRDGCTRAAGANAITFADGDEVRVPTGAASPRFVVVWVEKVDVGTNREFKRAYLMRHTA